MPDKPENEQAEAQPQEQAPQEARAPAGEQVEEQGPDAANLADMAAVLNLARSLGQVINNTYLYGPSHKVTLQSREQSYEILNQLLAQWERVNFSMAENDLLADGRIMDLKNPLVGAFAKQIKALGISGFSLERGMPRDEFDKLVELINTHPDKMKELGSFSQAVSSVGLAHVQARTAIYQLVTEEDLVVRKGDLEQALTEAGTASAVGGIEQVIEYLSGKAKGGAGGAKEGEGDTAGVQQQLTSIAEDATELANVIMKAAEIQKEGEGDGGRTFVELVVNSLKLAYESLARDPSVRTQQGKKSLSKTLLLLQQEIVSKFREAGGEETGARSIAAALEEMVNELQIDALAADYTKKRNAIENTEKKVVKFIDKVEEEEPSAIDVLKEEFLSRGLTEEGWEELLTKAHARRRKERAEPLPAAAADAGELNKLLTQLVETVVAGTQETPPPDLDAQVVQVLTKVDQEVSQVVQHTEERLQELAEEIRALDEQPARTKAAAAKQAMSRRRLIATLAEIVQELCQPLSVVNCTLDMLKSKILGAITPQQEEMIVLASSSGERLRVIIDKLLLISGVPSSTLPDTGILKKLYE